MINNFQNIFGLSKPIVIAGPCSAETEKQTLETAHQLKKHENLIFRAGIWKPRTRPNSFEGIGSKGLQWLQKIMFILIKQSKPLSFGNFG